MKPLTQRTDFLAALTTGRHASKICAVTCSGIRFSATEAILYLDPRFLPPNCSEWHVNCSIAVPVAFNNVDKEFLKLGVRTS